MAIRKFEAAAKSFGSLVSTDSPVFSVPDYQRRYEWRKEQVGQLWDDLISAVVEHPDEEYFIGAVVFYTDRQRNRLQIMDGQQRLATLTVLLAALRDKFEDLQEKERARQIHQYIVRRTLSQQDEPILELNNTDGQFLRERIQPLHGMRSNQEKKRSVRGRPPKNYIKEAYEYYFDAIGGDLEPLPATGKVDRLERLAQFIISKIIFIATIVESLVDAHVVFETLNDRGLELSIGNLVKNLLFSYGDKHSRSNDVKRFWSQTESHLADLGESAFKRFLRHYWLSAYARVTHRELYRGVTTYLKNQGRDGAVKFAHELADEAQIYRGLVEPMADDPNQQELRDLREMGLAQHLPLLLAAKARLDEKQFSRLVALCEFVTVRYLLVEDGNPNRLETSYSAWALKLRKGRERALESIIQAAKELCPSDDKFADKFASLVANVKVARYLLRKINEYKSGREMVPGQSSDVHVEHIFPRSPAKEWNEHISEDEGSQWVDRLGNLTLLAQGLNQNISNRSFDTKKREYAKSEIRITKELTSTAVWNAKAIEERQRAFSDLAPKIWTL